MPIRSAIAFLGYQITEQLYAGSRTLVYRAICDADQQSVVIKLLKNEHPSFSELVQFRNQYTLAKNLEISGIVKPYSLQPFNNGYALVMEDFGGSSLQHFVDGQPLSLEQFWSIALQLTDILHSLHQQRVIHKDIKPANILIQPETGQVKLIDFSISSLLPKETQEIKALAELEGTLAYLSPEQTGRMNRGIDYRSDFYSLGVTFYQLLSGRLPFRSSDPIEMVHRHIAERPLPVCAVNPRIPLMLGEIVHKLMAKNAEDRYQSALGLKHDLITCRTHWRTTGNLSEFELGQRDLCDRFLIPEKLYGREPEIKALLEAFERVAQGAAELMLVTGFSGIGKTAVVNEVHKPLVQQRGYFIKGKYDQFNRDIPLSAFVQALRDLMGQLLCESDEQLTHWQNRILEALGENGQVLIEVIPELERIIGRQQLATELSGTAAQNRFNRLFQKFVAVFTTQEHPLVVFLDDLQWADSASLNLMQVLMSQSDISYLLLIGAYRDNEVSPAHPLMLTLGEIEKVAIVNTWSLTPLSQADVNCLIADTLSCSIALAAPLTELIYPKTQGNPFFTTQFLKALHEDGLIAFDWDAGFWRCDVSQVRSLAITDDVVEFMALQLQKLPEAAQTVLKLAACIGNQFDLTTLAIAAGAHSTTATKHPETEIAAVLWKAVQEGLVIPQNDVYKFFGSGFSDRSQPDDWSAHQPDHLSVTPTVVYKFLHDRVQQAAYSLIPDEQKQLIHLQIGRLLQQATPDTEQTKMLFTIVNHLNKGASLIAAEQQELAQLNLAAGQKAKSATAYKAALDYFNLGIARLSNDLWQHQYDLTLALYEGAVNAAYLSTDFEQMQQLAEVVLTQAHSWLDRIDIYETKIQACMAQNQQLEALRLAREVLKHLNVPLPEHPTQADVERAIQHTQTLLGGRAIASLLELSPMTAETPKAAMVILSRIISAAYQAAPNLLLLVILAHIDLSVQYGNAPESANGYVLFGLVQIAVLKDIEVGGHFGQLGMSLSQSIYTPKLTSRLIFTFNCLLRHWQCPAKETLAGYLQAYATGLEIGDIEHAALGLTYYDLTAYYSGQELSSLKQEIEDHCQIVQQLRQTTYLYTQRVYCQAIANLLEPTAEPDRLHGEYCHEAETISLLLKANDMTALYCVYFNKLLLSYLFQRYEQALTNASLAEQYLRATAGLIYVPLFSFYDALLRLAIYSTVSETDRAMILDRVAAHQENLSEWSVHAPSNQAHRCALVAAERCRVLGQKAEAIDLYDCAIMTAKENEYIQEQAIANELAAKFYLEWGKERIAQHYLIEAYYCYARWGAKAKILDLETRYSQLLAPILQQSRSSLSVNETVFTSTTVTHATSFNSISTALDLAAILKASQTLSSEIELGKLLSTLLQLVIENAGADKCVLMLMHDDSLSSSRGERLFIKGLTTIDTEPTVLQRILIEESQDIPLTVIYSVKNRLEPVVLMDTTTHPDFINDPYFLKQQPKSVLCSPILHQGKLLGIVYLENNLMSGAFTSDRIHILNTLCAQATISLENARLYQRSQDHTQELEQSLEKLRASEARFQRMADNLPGVVYQLRYHPDGSASTPFISSGCTALFEVSPEDIMTGVKDFRDMEHPEDRRAIEQMAIQATQTLTPFEQESRIISSSGSVKWIQTVSRPEKQADGSILWDGIKIDITDRKQAEISLAKEREFLNAILHTITDGIVVCDASGQLVLFNHAAREFHGLPAQSLFSKQWVEHSDLYQLDSKTPLLKTEVPLFRALQGEIVANAEMVIMPKQGSARFLLVSGQAIVDPSGNHLGAVVVMRDVSDRKQAEQEQARLLAILEATSDIVGMADAAGNNIYLNKAGQKILQIPPEETNQFNISEAIASSALETMEKEMLPAAIQEGIWSGESLLRNRTGEEIPVSQVLMSHKNAQGEVVFLSTIMRDIRERKQAEQALQQKSQALEAALKELQHAQIQIIQSEKMSALGNLVAGVAHEINNPVGFIAGNLQPALDYVKDTFGLLDLYQQEYPHPNAIIQNEIETIDLDYVRQDLPKLISSMKLGVDRIRGISTSLRTFSRADKDYKVYFDIHEGIDSTILILKHRLKANSKRPEIKVDTDYRDIPIIECFPGQLNQVFMNILANAIDALEEAGQKLTFETLVANPNRIEIQTQLDNSGKQVIICIRDNGAGMTDEVKQRVFDHLFTTKAVGKGTGLGLAIVNQIIVENHGGAIKVNSTLGIGTEFVITLPITAKNAL